jgi:diketogulonate reductase-like aldo/keto reductase
MSHTYQLGSFTRRVTCCRFGKPASGSPSPSFRGMASASPFGSHSRLGGDKPAFTYGTAWKKDQTKVLVKEALEQGFRRVDTAAQPKHYQEYLVGEALREAYIEGLVSRQDVYVQTKYTTPAGQDLSNMPYDPNAPLDTQLQTSVASSLNNLRNQEESTEGTYLDCLLLHSPLPTLEQTLEAWKLLETFVPHKIKALGISNVTLPVVREIYNSSTVKPSVVQNRFYAQTHYDGPLRAFCREHGITYQSFWTLTGNPKLLKSKPVQELAQAAAVSVPTALYALVMELGVEVLNGTTSAEHMQDDLAGVQRVRDWAVSNARQWSQIVRDFAFLTEPKF